LFIANYYGVIRTAQFSLFSVMPQIYAL